MPQKSTFSKKKKVTLALMVLSGFFPLYKLKKGLCKFTDAPSEHQHYSIYMACATSHAFMVDIVTHGISRCKQCLLVIGWFHPLYQVCTRSKITG